MFGVSLVSIGIATLAIRGIAGDAVVGSLATTAAAEPVVAEAWRIGTQLLEAMATSLIVTGTLTFLGAWLAGPMRLATGMRRIMAPYMRDYPFVVAGGAVLAYLIAIWWGPFLGLRTPLGIVVNGAVWFAGVAALRQLIVNEFPDEQAGAVRDYVRGQWTAWRARPAGGSGAKASPAVAGDQLERLERLSALKERGVLNDEEFQQEKALILSG